MRIFVIIIMIFFTSMTQAKSGLSNIRFKKLKAKSYLFKRPIYSNKPNLILDDHLRNILFESDSLTLEERSELNLDILWKQIELESDDQTQLFKIGKLKMGDYTGYFVKVDISNCLDLERVFMLLVDRDDCITKVIQLTFVTGCEGGVFIMNSSFEYIKKYDRIRINRITYNETYYYEEIDGEEVTVLSEDVTLEIIVLNLSINELEITKEKFNCSRK